MIDVAGDTMYEFFSRSRQQEVCNAIMWYVMEACNTDCVLVLNFKKVDFIK